MRVRSLGRQHYYDQLVRISSHLNSATTVGQVAPDRAQVGNDWSSWGTRSEDSRAGGHSTYVRDFRNGTTVVTFVTWA